MGKTQSSCGQRKLKPSLIRELFALYSLGHSIRDIARRTSMSPNTVSRLCSRLDAGNLKTEELTTIGDEQLLQLAYPPRPSVTDTCADSVRLGRYIPDFKALAALQIENRTPVNILFNNYVTLCGEKNLQPLSQTYFYRELRKRLELLNVKVPEYYLMQDFPYGEEMQVDFTGDSYELATPAGRLKCWIMVLAFPASYYVFAGFVTAQSTSESCRVLADAVRYLGNRRPAFLVCDNAKSWVISHKDSDVVYNSNFLAFTAALGLCLRAAFPRHPQAKSAVEASVGYVQNKIRNDPIFRKSLTESKTIDEHSRLLQELVQEQINKAPLRRNAEHTREYIFRQFEFPLLQPVSEIPVYYEEVFTVNVPKSYHIAVKRHKYSVPCQYVSRTVEVYLSSGEVLVKCDGEVIARHQRTDGPLQCIKMESTTDPEHRPEIHRKIAAHAQQANRSMNRNTIMVTASELDENLWAFCQRRLQELSSYMGRTNNGAGPVRKFSPELTQKLEMYARSTCAAVIRAYENAEFKELFSAACKNVLNNLPSSKWRKDNVMAEYMRLVRTKGAAGRFANTPRVNMAGGRDVHLNSGEDVSGRDSRGPLSPEAGGLPLPGAGSASWRDTGGMPLPGVGSASSWLDSGSRSRRQDASGVQGTIPGLL